MTTPKKSNKNELHIENINVNFIKKHYECMFIVTPRISVKECYDNIINHLKSLDENLVITREENLGLMNFAYTIEKNDSGMYYLFNFTTEPRISDEFNKYLSTNIDVLRYLIIETENPISKPSALMNMINAKNVSDNEDISDEILSDDLVD